MSPSEGKGALEPNCLVLDPACASSLQRQYGWANSLALWCPRFLLQ